MPRAKKRTTRKRTTRSRKSSSVAGTYRTFNGQRYKKKSCHTTKAAAKSAAKKHRAGSKSKKARVVGKCVYTRG